MYDVRIEGMSVKGGQFFVKPKGYEVTSLDLSDYFPDQIGCDVVVKDGGLLVKDYQHAIKKGVDVIGVLTRGLLRKGIDCERVSVEDLDDDDIEGLKADGLQEPVIERLADWFHEAHVRCPYCGKELVASGEPDEVYQNGINMLNEHIEIHEIK